ncbi:MAG: phospholipase A [Gammaproteobacteria bacterium]
MNKLLFQLTALLFYTVPAIAVDMPQSCREMINPDERLACYDQIDKDNSQTLTGTILDDRIQQEMPSLDSSFNLTAHRPSYILPLSYIADPNNTPSSPIQPPPPIEGDLDNLEVKFQISFKVLMNKNFFFKGSNLWFGYTQLSLWQLYNSDASAPFRETNYEPELLWSFLVNKSFGKLKLTHIIPALNHQSNGRSDPISRSWNRLALDSIWAYENWVFSFRPWLRLPEADENDNNPDIDDYLGNFDFKAGYKHKDHQFSSIFRSSFDSDKPRSFYELGYSYSINRKFRGYIQFVSGYGETLIDYNYRNKRLSIGIMLNDWF